MRTHRDLADAMVRDTAELAEAHHRAELADARVRYVAAISHDFGTPIAALTMLHDILTGTKDLVQTIGARRLQQMRASLDLLSEVRQRAIDLSKLQQGVKLQPNCMCFQPSELLEKIQLLAECMPKKDTVELVYRLSTLDGGSRPCPEVVISDRGWLFNVAINFLSNAFKHTRDGAVIVDICVVDGTADGTAAAEPMLRLQVADCGQGVPDDMVTRLFAPYAQASKYRFGTGLGLYHVSELAGALGGHAGHRRNEPTGAIFYIDVPLVVPMADLQGTTAFAAAARVASTSAEVAASRSVAIRTRADSMSPAAGPSVCDAFHAATAEARRLDVGSSTASFSAAAIDDEPSRPSAGLHVLVVEDDEFIRETQCLLLEAHEGIASVCSGSDGEEGLARLVDMPQSCLAVIDLQMPRMDGLGCVRALRAWEAQQQPVRRSFAVALSANGADADWLQECLAAGFDQVREKPMSARMIDEIVSQATASLSAAPTAA